MAVVTLDAGHGGYDNGASYQGRREKDDNLNLARAVGNILQNRGVDVRYTRMEDIQKTILLQNKEKRMQSLRKAGGCPKPYNIIFYKNTLFLLIYMI